ncbi:MAG: hypothetical protein IT243_06235 [Bacteroidia bacterium]|nr:hypothetical protein [Bacteroidia bacterium]
MKNIFVSGDIKTFELQVGTENIANFDSGIVHNVLSTFSIGKYAEWASRLFVLEMKDNDEEGIGTYLEIFHKSPALLGEKVLFTAIFHKLEKNNVFCFFKAEVGVRLVAQGKTGQKILKKDLLNDKFLKLKTDV